MGSRPPRYAPKERFRTRRSGAEASEDPAAFPQYAQTAIDRPIVDVDALQHPEEDTQPIVDPARQDPTRQDPARQGSTGGGRRRWGWLLWLGIAALVLAALAGALVAALP